MSAYSDRSGSGPGLYSNFFKGTLFHEVQSHNLLSFIRQLLDGSGQVAAKLEPLLFVGRVSVPKLISQGRNSQSG